MAVREYAAKTTAMAVIISLGATEIARPANQRAAIEEKFVSEDPIVVAMLAEGPELCLQRISERILRDYSKEVFLNYCQRCGALARTPWAKQYRHCFFSWHDR